MKKKISVVIPTYRRPELLQKCIMALCGQNISPEDFEIIVVSDGPDDKTRNVLNDIRYGHPFIQFISLPRRQGPAAARNAGWKLANAPLVAFTDDDCQPDPGWLKGFVNEFNKNESLQYGAYTGKVIVPITDPPTDFELNTSHLATATFITANCACTKQSLELIGGFDERFTVAWREDSDLEFRLMQHEIPVLKVTEAIVVHPVREAPWGVSIREQKKTFFNALLYKKFPVLFRERIQPSPTWSYYFIVAGFIIMISGLLIQRPYFSMAGASLYLILTVTFIARRLARTSKSWKHVSEMIVTSFIIPFSSVYWTIYGAVKYKVLFI